jgi:hypothetical protein
MINIGGKYIEFPCEDGDFTPEGKEAFSRAVSGA